MTRGCFLALVSVFVLLGFVACLVGAPLPFPKKMEPGVYRLEWSMGDCKLVLDRDGEYHMWRWKDRQLVMWGDWRVDESGLSLQSRVCPVAFSLYYGFDLRTGKCYQGGTFTLKRIK